MISAKWTLLLRVCWLSIAGFTQERSHFNVKNVAWPSLNVQHWLTIRKFIQASGEGTLNASYTSSASHAHVTTHQSKSYILTYACPLVKVLMGNFLVSLVQKSLLVRNV